MIGVSIAARTGFLRPSAPARKTRFWRTFRTQWTNQMKLCAHLTGKRVLLHTNHQNKPTYEHHQTFPVSDRVVRHARPVLFRTPPYSQLPAPMGGFDPLGPLPIHLFHGVSGLTDLCAYGLARERLDQTDRRARHASSHVRRACIASKNEKNREKSHGPRSK